MFVHGIVARKNAFVVVRAVVVVVVLVAVAVIVAFQARMSDGLVGESCYATAADTPLCASAPVSSQWPITSNKGPLLQSGAFLV